MKNLNRKGFTLVELLSVIVILSVIVLIATNAVVPMADSAKKQVLAMAQTLYIQENSSSSKCYTYDEIISSGLIEKNDENYTGSISIEVDSSGNYTYKIWLSNGQYMIKGVKPDVTSDNVETSAEDASTTCSAN